MILLLLYLFIFSLLSYIAFKGFNKINWFKKSILNNLLIITLSLFSFLCLVLFFKSLIIEPFKVPTSSMEDTIEIGDVIIVDKVSIKFKLVDRGDIIVFKDLNNDFFVKRCIGIAGDLLRIKNGDVYINNKIEKSINGVKMKYQIKVKNNAGFYKILDSLNINSNIYPYSKNTFEGILNIKNKMKLKNSVKIVSINRTSFSQIKDKLFFNTNKQSWTNDSTGYIRTPKKGMKLPLDENTYDYYLKTMEQYEGINIKRSDNKYFINGLEVENYTFKNDYIFVLGDNRDNSLDSRFKGFVPHYLILGTVNIVF